MWLDLEQDEAAQGLDIDQAYADITSFCADWTANNIVNQAGHGDTEPMYTFLDEIVLPRPKFKRIETRVRYEFKNGKFKSFFEAENQCGEFFEHVFAKYVEHIDDSSLVRMYIIHPLFDNPINTSQIVKTQFTPSVVYKSFFETLQSKKKLG
jgi:hypothetical protein